MAWYYERLSLIIMLFYGHQIYRQLQYLLSFLHSDRFLNLRL